MKVDVLALSAAAFAVGLLLSSFSMPESDSVQEVPPALLQGIAMVDSQ